MTQSKKSYLVLAAFIILFQVVGGLIGSMTSGEMDGWYIPLEKSPLSPPGYVFGIVWTTLYAFLAVALWLIWKQPKSDLRKTALALFGVHMIMNWAWSPVFFSMHLVLPALILLLTILGTAMILAKMSWNLDRRAFLLFIPYIAWLCLASHLNYYILQHNP